MGVEVKEYNFKLMSLWLVFKIRRMWCVWPLRTNFLYSLKKYEEHFNISTSTTSTYASWRSCKDKTIWCVYIFSCSAAEFKWACIIQVTAIHYGEELPDEQIMVMDWDAKCRNTAVNNALRKREEINPFYRQDVF